MLDHIDEYACIKVYDNVKSRKMEFVPALDRFNELEKKRKHN